MLRVWGFALIHGLICSAAGGSADIPAGESPCDKMRELSPAAKTRSESALPRTTDAPHVRAALQEGLSVLLDEYALFHPPFTQAGFRNDEIRRAEEEWKTKLEGADPELRGLVERALVAMPEWPSKYQRYLFGHLLFYMGQDRQIHANVGRNAESLSLLKQALRGMIDTTPETRTITLMELSGAPPRESREYLEAALAFLSDPKHYMHTWPIPVSHNAPWVLGSAIRALKVADGKDARINPILNGACLNLDENVRAEAQLALLSRGEIPPHFDKLVDETSLGLLESLVDVHASGKLSGPLLEKLGPVIGKYRDLAKAPPTVDPAWRPPLPPDNRYDSNLAARIKEGGNVAKKTLRFLTEFKIVGSKIEAAKKIHAAPYN